MALAEALLFAASIPAGKLTLPQVPPLQLAGFARASALRDRAFPGARHSSLLLAKPWSRPLRIATALLVPSAGAVLLRSTPACTGMRRCGIFTAIDTTTGCTIIRMRSRWQEVATPCGIGMSR
jgi:hypothetical protein